MFLIIVVYLTFYFDCYVDFECWNEIGNHVNHVLLWPSFEVKYKNYWVFCVVASCFCIPALCVAVLNHLANIIIYHTNWLFMRRPLHHVWSRHSSKYPLQLASWQLLSFRATRTRFPLYNFIVYSLKTLRIILVILYNHLAWAFLPCGSVI